MLEIQELTLESFKIENPGKDIIDQKDLDVSVKMVTKAGSNIGTLEINPSYGSGLKLNWSQKVLDCANQLKKMIREEINNLII